jgi:hypothetical protein
MAKSSVIEAMDHEQEEALLQKIARRSCCASGVRNRFEASLPREANAR